MDIFNKLKIIFFIFICLIPFNALCAETHQVSGIGLVIDTKSHQVNSEIANDMLRSFIINFSGNTVYFVQKNYVQRPQKVECPKSTFPKEILKLFNLENNFMDLINRTKEQKKSTVAVVEITAEIMETNKIRDLIPAKVRSIDGIDISGGTLLLTKLYFPSRSAKEPMPILAIAGGNIGLTEPYLVNSYMVSDLGRSN